ncbi:MAG: hypothetical protein WDM94_04745 [Bauldia sp.]
MLRRLTLLALLAVAGADVAVAAEALQPGSVYGTDEGCAAVAAGEYPATDDWTVVTRKSLHQHESVCEFVQTLPGRDGSLFVNAICSGEGDTWPATFAILAGEDDGALRIADSNNNPWDVHACDGQTDAAADKLFGE